MNASAILHAVLLAAGLLLWARPAEAIPAFARKYHTSCLTCHVIYPKLNPFGEAFRRNGYRFPGIDGDMIKMETVPLGQEANRALFPRAAWPANLPGSAPLAFSVNGSATLHPDVHSSAAQADNNAPFSLHDLIGEAHLFAGGSLTEHITFFAQVTFSSDKTVNVEEARIHFNDIGNLNHAFNLWVGKGASTLSSFGYHSAYVNDTFYTPLAVTGLYGATSNSWNLADQYNTIELNGMIKGRLIYSAGINAGANSDVRTTQNAYGHLGFKLGGLRLDGEGGALPKNSLRPWEETALTVDGFFYRSASHFTNAAMGGQDDTSLTFGGTLRLQIYSFELNAGAYMERHDNALPADAKGMGGGPVNALAAFSEVSYVIFPWLVPAVRVEYLRLEPQGGPVPSYVHLAPGIAVLILPNLKLTLLGDIEYAQGAPSAGWGAAGGSIVPPMALAGTPVPMAGPEVESLQLGFAF